MAGRRRSSHLEPVRLEHRAVHFGHNDGVVHDWQLSQRNTIARNNAIVRVNDSIAQIIDYIEELHRAKRQHAVWLGPGEDQCHRRQAD
jgi:hypothetical protein